MSLASRLRFAPPVLAASAILLVVAALAAAMQAHDRSLRQRLLEVRAASASDQVEAQVDSRVLTLVRLTSEWAAVAPREPKRWAESAGHHLSGIGYAALLWVAPDARFEVVAQRRGAASEHTAALLEGPLSGLLSATRLSDSIGLSDPFPWSGQPAFAVVIPSYRAGVFDGWFAAIFEARPFLGWVLSNVATGYAVAIRGEASPLFERDADEAIGDAASRPVDIYGARWTVAVSPTRTVAAEWHTHLGDAMLGVGLVLAVAVGAVAYAAQRAAAERMVAETARRALELDIAERRRAETELAQANRQLERTDRLREKFISVLAHDVRSPLAVIGTALDLLGQSQTRFSPDDASLLEMIGRQSERVVGLCENLLDLSRMEAGRLVAERETIDLRRLVAGVVGDLRTVRPGEKAAVHLDLDPRPALVSGDPRALGQVVANLLANAIRHARGEVWVQVRVDGQAARLTVEDDGPGVAVEERERIFERFVAVGRDGGVGLGLAIVREIVHAHGGRVTVGDRNSRGSGAAFLVALPTVTGPAVQAERETAPSSLPPSP